MAYTGTKVKLGLGEFGLLTDVAPDKAPPGTLIGANNICFFNGSVQKAPGSRKWNSVALGSPIVALQSWNPTIVVQRMVAVTKDGKIYKGQDRQFGAPINTDLGELTPNCVFAEGGAETAGRDKKLFLFTGGKTNPYVLIGDGEKFTPIISPSPDWTGVNFPKFGVVHRNRLWAFAGQISYASDSGNHENFNSNALVEPIYPGEGGELRGAFVYKGRLLAFKDGGFVYLLNESTDENGDELFVWDKIASNFGLSAPNGIAEVLNNLYAGNTSGTITDYAATDKLGSIEAADLVQNLLFEEHLRGNASKVGVPEQHLLYYPEKKLLFATYRSQYKTTNDMLLVFDFGRPSQIRPSFWIKGSPQCLAKYKDVNQIERPMYGDANGYVMLMDSEDRSEGGSPFIGDFQIAHTDFSFADQSLSSQEKHFDFLAVHYVPESVGNLMCDYFIDGRYIETISFVMIQNRDAQLDVMKLGTNRLAQRNTETCTRELCGSGRTFSARFYNEGNNQSFQIPAITVYFRGGGDKTQEENR